MFMLDFTWRDLLDILLVTVLLYRVMLLTKGTRAIAALSGLAVMVLIYAIANVLGLYTLTWLLEHLFSSLFLVIVILFHDDIRQALAKMGTQSLWRRKKRNVNTELINDLLWVCLYFAKKRIGAIIVLEGKVLLGDFMKGGVALDAKVSRELLMTIFYPMTALHDGAIIIRSGRIVAAGCILPLADMNRQHFGTRHRAAIGVTEVSDATTIVVSEERGEISITVGGKMEVVKNMEQFRYTLENILRK